MPLTIPDPLAERLRETARARGLAVEAYLQSLVDAPVPEASDPEPVPVSGVRATEKWKAWEREVQEFNKRHKIGPIPEGAFSAEALYEYEGE